MSEIGCNIVIGFGYSDVDNDYKVVRNLSGSGTSFSSSSCRSSKIWSKAEVYSLRSGKWKVINDSVYDLPIDVNPHFVDGCLYWLPVDYKQQYLQFFDFNDEVFRQIEMPPKFTYLRRCHVSCIFQLNGSLALSVIGHKFTKPAGDLLCIFVMGKGNDNSGQVHWKELSLDNTDNKVSVSYYGLGFNGSGRLEFEDWKGYDEVWHPARDYEAEVDWRRICKLGALNLDNLNAAETLILEFQNCVTIDPNIIASLVSFSD